MPPADPFVPPKQWLQWVDLSLTTVTPTFVRTLIQKVKEGQQTLMAKLSANGGSAANLDLDDLEDLIPKSCYTLRPATKQKCKNCKVEFTQIEKSSFCPACTRRNLDATPMTKEQQDAVTKIQVG
jgi:hypothetical protein